MTKLKNTIVFRGALSGTNLRHETGDVGVTNLNLRGLPKLQVSFVISSAGGGQTDIVIDIGEEDYPALLARMLETSKTKVLPIMASAVAHHMKTLPEREEKLRSAGREQVLSKAHEAWRKAPPGEGEIEGLVHKRVDKFVKDLDSNTAPKPAPIPLVKVTSTQILADLTERRERLGEGP